MFAHLEDLRTRDEAFDVETPASQTIPITNFQISLNTNITSRLLGAGNVSEATLLIDEPNPPDSAAVPDSTVAPPRPSSPPQILCAPGSSPCAETGTGGSPSPYQTQPNVFLAQQTASNTLSWSIPFDAPGPDMSRLIRITNLRANASHQDSELLVQITKTCLTALKSRQETCSAHAEKPLLT